MIWLMPVGLLLGLGVRSGDWVLVGAVVGLVLVFGLLVLWVWLGSRRVEVHQLVKLPEPLALEAAKPVPPLARGVFVDAETGGGR